MALQKISPPALGRSLAPNIWDAAALTLIVGALVLIVYGAEQTNAPISALDITPVSLDPANLPVYALRTTLRMLAAIACSIVFTFIYAALAANTSQAWNRTFSMYQSLRNVPKDLEEASLSFHLSGWQRFWRLDVPFAMPGLIWNTMMSMSGGWFFVRGTEIHTVGIYTYS